MNSIYMKKVRLLIQLMKWSLPYCSIIIVGILGVVSQKAGYLTDPVKNRNSVNMIIIISNNKCGVNHIYL